MHAIQFFMSWSTSKCEFESDVAVNVTSHCWRCEVVKSDRYVVRELFEVEDVDSKSISEEHKFLIKYDDILLAKLL